MVRDALEALPTALQTPASEEIGIESPFARSLRTHFARIFVIDAPAYNGRDNPGTLRSTIDAVDLLAAQPVDRLSCPYIAFIGDFDPAADGAAEPRSWLTELWTVAKAELCSVFKYCYQFDPDGDAGAFADFVMKGQVETTMPFNDYWITAPPIPNLGAGELLIPVLGAAILAIVIASGSGFSVWTYGWSAFAAIGLGFCLLIVLPCLPHRRQAPSLPPNATLRDVKALTCSRPSPASLSSQQAGARRAARRLRATPRRDPPNDLSGPTQPPGVVRATSSEAADA
jgi:hypothetical protein